MQGSSRLAQQTLHVDPRPSGREGRAGTARLLTVAGGAAQVTDGPFAETTEQLGGFYLVRTADPDGLLRLAAPLVMGDGTLELRPVTAHDAGTTDDAEAAVAQPATTHEVRECVTP